MFRRTGRIWNLHVAGQLIRTTGEHPFYVYNKGWIAASELQPGDMLSSHDGQCRAIEEVYDTGEYETVYNLRVADFHTYFVGSEDWGFSVWAHNASYQRVGVTDELAQKALDKRKTLDNPLTGKNVMVVEYVDKKGNLKTKTMVSDGTHTERMIPEGTKVTRIFTEREPCKNCFNYIETQFPTAEVTYLFSYRDKATRVPTSTIQSIFGKSGGWGCVLGNGERVGTKEA